MEFGILKYIKTSHYGVHYDTAIKIYNDNKYFGIGLKQFRYESSKEIYDSNENNIYKRDNWATHPHQIHFEMLSETGLFGYISTHASCTIILCTQDFASVPISVRRKSTHWVLFPSVDYSANRHVSQATGHSFKQLAKLCKTKHDSICFDMSGNGGPPLRLNLYLPIGDSGEED